MIGYALNVVKKLKTLILKLHKRKDKKMTKSYPIWNKITACIYKSGKSYGVKRDGLTEILIGTSASNSHEFAKVRTTHRKNEDGTRTYHLYIDDKLYKKATLKNKEIQIEKISN